RLELSGRQGARIAADAALRAAVGQAQQRALPGHPHRQRGALAERDVRVVADAALRRAEHARVLHAVSGKDRSAAVVELDRDADDQRALGNAQAVDDRVADLSEWSGLLKLRKG